jgi:hypothetical protein
MTSRARLSFWFGSRANPARRNERDREQTPDPALSRYFFTQAITAVVFCGPSQLAPPVPSMCSVLPSTLQYALIITSSG